MSHLKPVTEAFSRPYYLEVDHQANFKGLTFELTWLLVFWVERIKVNCYYIYALLASFDSRLTVRSTLALYMSEIPEINMFKAYF